MVRADSTKNSDPYKVGIKKPKTGGFVGGEFGFGSSYATTENIDGYYTPSGNGTAFPINVFGGYQWYFYDRPWFHFGVRVRGHIGYSNYNADISRYLYGGRLNIALSAHAIQYGAEAQFLWDFLNMGEHTLGWHISPVGLEGSTFFGSFEATATAVNIKVSGDLAGHTKFTYAFSTGFHYYYSARHLVFATYKSRYYNLNESVGDANKLGYSTTANNLLMLGYAYKF